MRLFRFQKARYLAPLWTLFLVLGLIIFAARAPLAHLHHTSSSGHRSSAVLADNDASDDGDVTNQPARLLFVAPDGQIPELFQKLISVPVPLAILRIPAEVPFILPTRLLYTQLTSSAL